MSVRIQVFVEKGHVTILLVAIIANVRRATEEETAVWVGVPSLCENGSCHNTFGSYYCLCEAGYRGRNCDLGRCLFSKQ